MNPHPISSGPLLTVAAVLAAALVAAGHPQAAAGTVRAPAVRASAASPTTVVRVNQLGYPTEAHKVGYVMTSRSVPPPGFRVLDGRGRVVLSGRATATRGRWNTTYGAVFPVDLSAVRRPGRYVVESLGRRSPWFRVAPARTLLGPRVADVVAFFQAQRDGADVVPGPLHRKPSHLNDAHAAVYEWPTYEDPDSDVIVGSTLHRTGPAVDVEGGWFDAGDFVKFTHTTAYSDALLLIAQRDLGRRAPASLGRETRFGLDWLTKTWDPARNRMVIQVGIGSGNTGGTFNGDHDLWRLPEVDDELPGPQNRYLAHRPAFVTDAHPGRLAPNLAGRVAATFALAAQVDAGPHPARARAELALAEQVYSHARTVGVSESDVVTALPHAFYPETAWRDDLELGAAELALATRALHQPGEEHWLDTGRRWAGQYLRHEAGSDTLNLYDVSAVAHAELAAALRGSARVAVARATTAALEQDLRRQLRAGQARAANDPFRAGGQQDDFDVASHTFGLAATASLYRRTTGSHRYDGFGTGQVGWALGANPWGQSLMIGVGTSFPQCPQHVVANLSGDAAGRAVLRGAVVNGPNDASLFDDGLGEFFDNGRTCPADGVDQNAAFNGHGSAYVDDVRSWQTVEPANDFTATAALAFALGSRAG